VLCRVFVFVFVMCVMCLLLFHVMLCYVISSHHMISHIFLSIWTYHNW
jgi:hypothetical protein